MILVIGERINDPLMKLDRVRTWKYMWRCENAIRFIMTTPGMVYGPTRASLLKLLGTEPDRIINLLPPDSKSGSWDIKLAEESANTLVKFLWTEEGKKWDRVILLGRRVAEAFQYHTGKMEFGSDCHLASSKILVLPHPSGRSTVLNDPARWQSYHQIAKEFHGRCEHASETRAA